MTDNQEKIFFNLISFVTGFLVSMYVVCRISQGPLQAELNLIRELGAKGIRIRTMMIKTHTDCACCLDSKLNIPREVIKTEPKW